MLKIARLLPLFALLGFAPHAAAQINWYPVYPDGDIGPGGVGYADPTILPGEILSVGQLRRNSVNAAFNYLNNFLDSRNAAVVRFRSAFNGTGFLAQGYSFFVNRPGTFQISSVYQRARTGSVPANPNWPPYDADVAIDWNFPFKYSGQQSIPPSGAYDMTTVAIHEILHTCGFTPAVNPRGNAQNQFINGEGLRLSGGLEPDQYGEMARYLQRGNTPGQGALYGTNLSDAATFGKFIGDPSTFLNGNDPAVGLFFNGQYGSEAYGGLIPIYAPATWASGSSAAHPNTSPAGIMNRNLTPLTERRMLPYEIGMLLDFGWNVYLWNGTSGNWLDGVDSIGNSRWRTDRGIVNGRGQSGFYTNFNSANYPDPAYVYPPNAQVTSNIVLRFGGNSGYTTNNDIGSVRLARLELSSSAPDPVIITGGMLNFGQNADGSGSVLAPKIVQSGSGAVVIESTVQTNNVPTTVLEGVTFVGHTGVTVDGPGSGQVTLAGPVTGTGGMTKAGSFNLLLTNTANSYTGATNVQGGTLTLGAGTSIASTPSIAVQNGATFDVSAQSGGFTLGSATPQTLSGGGSVTGNLTVAGGSTLGGGLRNGNAVETLTVNGSVTVNGGARLTLDLAAFSGPPNDPGSPYSRDLLAVTGAGNALDFRTAGVGGGAFTIDLVGDDQLTLGASYTWAVASVNGGALVTENGAVPLFAYGSDFMLNSVSFEGFVNVSLFSTPNGLYLTFTPVPEPACVLTVAIGGLLIAHRRRRQTGRAFGDATATVSLPPFTS